MCESQVLLTDGQVVFLRVLRFSPTFDERSARYKWNILERAVKPKSKKKNPYLSLWTSPFPISGVSVLFSVLSVVIEISLCNANCEDPDQTPHSAASDLGLHCLSMSFIWDCRHKWVNWFCPLSNGVCSKRKDIRSKFFLLNETFCRQGLACSIKELLDEWQIVYTVIRCHILRSLFCCLKPVYSKS